ncbi:DUF2071 domain-containing protein [Fodinicola feengrottensis]
MLQALRRHPLAMRTTFGHSLMLMYAFEPALLRPMLPPGVELDTYQAPDGGEYGFVAVGVVSAQHLRPTVLPAGWGGDFLLTGYRIVARFPNPAGRTMRGLYILRSDTNRRSMQVGGNLLTRYRYQLADIRIDVVGPKLTATVDSRDGRADLAVVADLESRPSPSAPFRSAAAARRFAGPLPYTFDYEAKTGSIVVIKANRNRWQPHPVSVQVKRMNFFEHGGFAGSEPVLANAFHVADVDYGWERGSLRGWDGSIR